MVFELSKLNPATLMRRQAVSDVLKMNELSARFGLTLTQAQAEDLVETRFLALKDHGRIELGKGIAEKLIEVFCDSQYLNTDNYAEHLNELTEIFYYLKEESREQLRIDGQISDDEIINEMKTAFETICQGSIDLLAGREGMKIARAFAGEYMPDFNEDHNQNAAESLVGRVKIARSYAGNYEPDIDENYLYEREETDDDTDEWE